jgi:hypothetical protein
MAEDVVSQQQGVAMEELGFAGVEGGEEVGD